MVGSIAAPIERFKVTIARCDNEAIATSAAAFGSATPKERAGGAEDAIDS